VSNRASFTLAVTGAAALGLALALDVHRIILRAVWPSIESFWFTFIAF
jgi:hypothetical protein